MESRTYKDNFRNLILIWYKNLIIMYHKGKKIEANVDRVLG